MILSHSRAFVFVHVHKTAGEAVTAALAPHLGRGDVVLGTTTAGKVANLVYPKLKAIKKHSSALRLRDFCGEAVWDAYFTFAFVRDPVDRIRSLYDYTGKMLERRRERSLRNLVLGLPGASGADPLRWPGTRAYLETTSFSEFIRHPAFRSREQWRSVCDEDGRPLVDFIGRFERLEADFAHVSERLGLGPLSIEKRNASQGAPKAAVVSPEDRDHLLALHRRDFEIFGYEAAAA